MLNIDATYVFPCDTSSSELRKYNLELKTPTQLHYPSLTGMCMEYGAPNSWAYLVDI